MTTRTQARRSKLDNAIIASIAAMAAMNIFVLTSQAQSTATLAAVPVSEVHTA